MKKEEIMCFLCENYAKPISFLCIVGTLPISFLFVFLEYFLDIFPTFLGKLMHRPCILQWSYISFIKEMCITFEKNMHILLLCITLIVF